MLLHSTTIFIPKSYHSLIISNYIRLSPQISSKQILFIKPTAGFQYLNHKNCLQLLTNSYHKDIPLHIYNDFSTLSYHYNSYNFNSNIYFSFQSNKYLYWNIILDPIHYQLGY